MRGRDVLRDTLKKCRAGFGAVLLCFLVCGLIFALYELPAEPFLYAALLIAFLGLLLFLITLLRERRKAVERERMIASALTGSPLPPPDSLAEKDCQRVITLLQEELTALRESFDSARQDELDYYTAWVHQIKTPIAVMRMELGGSGEPSKRTLEAELFRVEQYADMVLQYIRLDGSDLVIEEYPLDELIRGAVRKFAPQFVAKRLSLSYEGTEKTVVTDRKWFSLILEQLISNAIKYTPAGGITIRVGERCVTVSDTGIGIAPEDVPRVFEKGFTGGNGRLEKRSSGLGLYLCRKAAELLALKVTVESTVGEGSSFTVDLSGKIKSDRLKT